MSYLDWTAHRQKIKNSSDRLRTTKSIKLSASAHTTNRNNPERRLSCARHLRNRYVCLRTGRTRAKCFIDTCCRSVRFAACVGRLWLISNVNVHENFPPDRIVGRGVGSCCPRREKDGVQHHRQFSRRKGNLSPKPAR